MKKTIRQTKLDRRRFGCFEPLTAHRLTPLFAVYRRRFLRMTHAYWRYDDPRQQTSMASQQSPPTPNKTLPRSLRALLWLGSFRVVLARIDPQDFYFHDNPQIHMNLRKET
ncbi:hypothetical protein KFK09_000576 [Dendrobium nobile]|uniref:Uncharacterized protein n=1 Tax=Dendrobium nobile TaxID=94219 RepID=A0A8T3CDI0_DENNO|nr:hypothetical protein KFK09_000576 [Dendrobium nobile]